jgi:hypothetical protein
MRSKSDICNPNVFSYRGLSSLLLLNGVASVSAGSLQKPLFNLFVFYFSIIHLQLLLSKRAKELVDVFSSFFSAKISMKIAHVPVSKNYET